MVASFEEMSRATEACREYDWLKRWLGSNGSTLMQEAWDKSELSVRFFAREIDVTPGYVCNVIAGRDPLSPKVARRILNMLTGVEVHF